ncbi:Metallo-dependent phosphatase-like protein [Phlyctochytrium arcticum]|nr:Metallo-dependent phosphatase-like protein [Phlyctochytrium arcticum]
MPQTSLLADEILSNRDMNLSEGESGRFLHITDMHLDPFYEEGAPLSSSCHRTSSVAYNPQPVHKTPRRDPSGSTTAGHYGSPGSGCDSPLILVNETMRFVSEVLNSGSGKHGKKGLDFILWTGDSARHDSDSRITRTEGEIRGLNALAVEYFYRSFPIRTDESAKTFSPPMANRHRPHDNPRTSIPVIPNIGNNDIHPHNNLLYTPDAPNPTLDYYALLWQHFIPADQSKAFRTTGNFYVDVKEDLRVASLNTMYLSDGNKWVTDCRSTSIQKKRPGRHDDDDQSTPAAGDSAIDWLIHSVLIPARKDSKSVYVIGHVPPSPINYFPRCYTRFADVMVEYADVIRGQFYGHMNIDHFFFPTPEDGVGEDLVGVSSLSTSKPDFSASPVPANLLPHVISRDLHRDSDSPLTTIPGWLNLYTHYLLRHYHLHAHDNNNNKTNPKPAHNLTSPIFVSPSVVPSFNPTLRVFEYTRSNGAVTDWVQYFADLVKWNRRAAKGHAPAYFLAGGGGKSHRGEIPGYLYEQSYRTSKHYAFNNTLVFAPSAWVDFAARLSGEAGDEKGSTKKLRKRYWKEMVVRVKGVDVGST